MCGNGAHRDAEESVSIRREIDQTIRALDSGDLRVAEKQSHTWIRNPGSLQTAN